MISYDVSRGRGRGHGRLEEKWEETCFRNFTPKKWPSKNQKYAKKIRAKILYIFHIETLQDLFSRANFDYFLF